VGDFPEWEQVSQKDVITLLRSIFLEPNGTEHENYKEPLENRPEEKIEGTRHSFFVLVVYQRLTIDRCWKMSRGTGLDDSVGRVSVQELHDYIRKNNTAVVSGSSNKKIRLTLPDGKFVKITRTLETFLLKGVKCRMCGIEGDYYYRFPIHDKENYVSLTLVSFLMDSSKVIRNHIEFTSDHTIPSCHGGTDFIENREPMCSLCNNRKDDTIPNVPTETVFRLATLRKWVFSRYRNYPLLPQYGMWHKDYMSSIFSGEDPNMPNSGSVTRRDAETYCILVKEMFGFEIPYEKFGKTKPMGMNYKDGTGILGFAVDREYISKTQDRNLLISVMNSLNLEDGRKKD